MSKVVMFLQADTTQLLLLLWTINMILGNWRAYKEKNWSSRQNVLGVVILVLWLVGYFVAWIIQNSAAIALLPSWVSMNAIQGSGVGTFAVQIGNNLTALKLIYGAGDKPKEKESDG